MVFYLKCLYISEYEINALDYAHIEWQCEKWHTSRNMHYYQGFNQNNDLSAEKNEIEKSDVHLF